jgi:hypothetical protein
MTTKVSIGLGGTGSNSAASTLTSIGAVAKSGDTMTGQLNISSGGLLVTGTANVSANVAVGAGSQTAPSLTRSGDTDTGIYFPAANEMAITTGGTVAQAFNSNGVFFRNRIINGDMRIDQRNAGAAVTTSGAYPVDRFFIANATDGAFSAQRDTVAPTGFTNSLKFTTTTADTSLGTSQIIYACQAIEGFNTSDFNWGTANAQTVTLSFWTRSSLTGTFGGTVRNAGSGSFRAYPFTYTISAANTWEYKTVTISGDTTGTWATDNTAGIYVFFGLGVGTSLSGTAGAWASSNLVSATGAVSVIGTLNATWYITGVQLETGSVATPFERRPFGEMLMLCQRYYEKSYDYATAAGSAVAEGYSAMNNADQGSAVYIFNVDVFKVTKRAAAIMRFWDLAGTLSRITDFTLGGLGRTDGRNSVYSYTGNVQNARMINVQNASTAGTYQWDASAEL